MEGRGGRLEGFPSVSPCYWCMKLHAPYRQVSEGAVLPAGGGEDGLVVTKTL